MCYKMSKGFRHIIAEGRTVAIMLLCVIATCWLSSCSDSDQQEEEEVLPDSSYAPSRTVMVYMAAENDLSGAAAVDIREMIAGMKDMTLYAHDRLVIFLDDVSLPRIYVLDRNVKAFSLSELNPVKTYTDELNSASASVLSDLVDYVQTYYPADSYGLVMWSHASGWIPSTYSGDTSLSSDTRRRAFGLDNGKNSATRIPGNQMDIADMACALEEKGGVDFILFDACMMQCVENAYELRNAARYIVASPAEIPGPGAYYTTMVRAMFKKDAYADEMVNAYYAQYCNQGNPYGIVISAVNTEHLPAYSAYMKELLAKHKDALFSLPYNSLLNYFRCEEWGFGSPDLFDMQGVMQQILDETEYESWLHEVSKVVNCKHAGYWYSDNEKGKVYINESQCCGLSMFVPRKIYDEYVTMNYNAAFAETGWAQYVWEFEQDKKDGGK